MQTRQYVTCLQIHDIHIPVGPSELAYESKHVKRLLKDLQPHREKPSKDRSRRFQAPTLYGDWLTPDDHDVNVFEF